jgi:LacI family transcriptional regulator
VARSKNEKTYRRVAICVDRSRGYGQSLLLGIADYVEAFGPWSLFLDPRSSAGESELWLSRWKGDGVLAFIESPSVARALARSKVATVELSGHRLDLKIPQVINDEIAFGRLAAEHLLDRRFSNFAFSGYRDCAWSDRRLFGFQTALRERAFEPAIFFSEREINPVESWNMVQEELLRWLSSLPKPLGLMACSDRHALRLLDACRRAGFAVPEEIAVIGVDNDEQLCRLADPPLTSVMDNARAIGFEAAGLLDRLMNGRARAANFSPILLPPRGVATRRSTDVTAITDEIIAGSVREIRERSGRGISVKELITASGVSRAVFYTRFRAAVGRLPLEEIQRVRLDRVKTLLLQTGLPLARIAEESGFEHPEYLSVLFKREMGCTPGKFRNTHGRGKKPAPTPSQAPPPKSENDRQTADSARSRKIRQTVS